MPFRRINPPGAPAPSPPSPPPLPETIDREVDDSATEPLDDGRPDYEDNPVDQEAPPDPEYKVGRGRPPRHTQWKKGQSGNPAGKKPGKRNTATIALEVLGEVMTVQTPAGPRRMNTVDMAYYKLRELVAKGDLKAIATVVAIWQQIVPAPAAGAEPGPTALAPHEQAMLEAMINQLGEAPQIKGRGKMVPATGKGGVS